MWTSQSFLVSQSIHANSTKNNSCFIAGWCGARVFLTWTPNQPNQLTRIQSHVERIQSGGPCLLRFPVSAPERMEVDWRIGERKESQRMFRRIKQNSFSACPSGIEVKLKIPDTEQNSLWTPAGCSVFLTLRPRHAWSSSSKCLRCQTSPSWLPWPVEAVRTGQFPPRRVVDVLLMVFQQIRWSHFTHPMRTAHTPWDDVDSFK